MCGISGIMGSHSKDNIEAMVCAMHHRGPDDFGIYSDNNISLGMARLAIMDISPKGHQPMSNENGTTWVVYNGEVYNFKTERTILEKFGYNFKSDCDTEVVLKLYEHYGDDFVLRMRGMFSLAVYDKRKGMGNERLLLARDYFGIKPLLYSNIDGRFLFASEMKSILASGLVKKEFDYESLRLLLTFGSITQPHTIINGINMLLPGYRMILENGHQRVEKYWELKTNRYPELRNMKYEELVEVIGEAIKQSVSLQMESDVPLGAFLSGGIDSSLLVSLMNKVANKKVRTFSVGFGDEGELIDETADAERIARYIGTVHSRVHVTGSDVRDKIMHIASSLDQPSVDGVNSYFVSLAAKNAVKVAISGTGGDELFAGYPWFRNMLKLFEMEDKSKLKTSVTSFIATVARKDSLNFVASTKLGKYLNKLRSMHGFLPTFAHQYQIFGSDGTSRILNSSVRKDCLTGRCQDHDLDINELLEGDPIERVTALCLRGYTQNQLLRDIDAVSMGHSLEVRVPFLDHVLTDMTLSLPSNAKMGILNDGIISEISTYKATGSKRILFDVGKKLLPLDMNTQPKRGFEMPFDKWLKGSMKDIMEDVFSTESIQRRGIFEKKEMEVIRSRFLDGKMHWTRPWLLIMIELWSRQVMD